MLNHLKLLLALVLLCIGAGTFTYFRAQDAISADRELDKLDQIGIKLTKSIFYPKKRDLTNSLGKNINASIIGRSSDKVVIIKESDSSTKEFRFSISKLSNDDQAFISQLPLTEKSKKQKTTKREPLKGKFGSGKLNQKKPFGSGLPFSDQSALIPESGNDSSKSTTTGSNQ